MADTLRHHPQVADDILSASQWYELHRQGLGTRFRETVRRQFALIAANPRLFPRVSSETDFCFARIPKFPYLILFQVDGGSAFIMGVLHSASDPAKWGLRRE